MTDFTRKSREETMAMSVPDKLNYLIEHQDALDEKVDPIVDGISFGKRFAAGLVTIIVSIAGIGSAVFWVIHLIRSYPHL